MYDYLGRYRKGYLNNDEETMKFFLLHLIFAIDYTHHRKETDDLVKENGAWSQELIHPASETERY